MHINDTPIMPNEVLDDENKNLYKKFYPIFAPAGKMFQQQPLQQPWYKRNPYTPLLILQAVKMKLEQFQKALEPGHYQLQLLQQLDQETTL